MAENQDLTLRVRLAVEGISSGFTKLKSAVGGANAKVQSSLGGWYNSVRKVNHSIYNLNKDANRANTIMGKFGKTLSVVGGLTGIGAIYTISRALTSSIGSALDMIETQNLFAVSLGETVNEAEKVVQELNTLYGLDPTNMRNAIGTYALLSKSMGMSASQAEVLSTNTTKLALDLSSLMNVDIEQVLADLRSGLVGQSETVYKYGIDVTEASLKTEALAQGITKSVRNMSQGEKMALRYATMLRQTSLAQGDMARTLESPANQLRILNEQFTTLTRSIGQLFIPILAKVLPYLNAFLSLTIDAVKSLASFLNVELPSFSNAIGLGTVTEDAENASDAVSELGKTAKKTILGIDQLNLMQAPESASATTGGAGSDILGQMKLPSLADFSASIKKVTDDLKKNLLPELKNILFWVNLIGVSMLAWKIAPSVLDFFTGGGTSAIAKIAKTIKGIFIPSGATVKLSSLFGNSVEYVSILAAFLAIVATIAIMILRFEELMSKSESFRNGLKIIGELGVTTLKGLDVLSQNISKSLGNIDVGISDIIITAGSFGLLFTPFAPFGIALLVFEGLTLAVRAVGDAFSPAIKKADLFAGAISDTTKAKLEPFIKNINDLQQTIDTLNFGNVEITEATVADITSKVKGISETLISELDADRNTNLANLEPLREAFSAEKFASYQEKINKYYDDSIEKVTSNEQEIVDIMKAMNDGTIKNKEEAFARINQLTQENYDLGLRQLSETAIEYETIMRNLKDNSVAISLEQATGILQNARDTRDQAIASAEEQYSRVLLSAQNMVDAGVITKEEYESIVRSAKYARDETVKTANQQYDGILQATKLKLGEASKFIDETTLQIKTKFAVFFEGVKKNWQEFLVSISDVTVAIDNLIITFMNSVSMGIKEMLNKLIDGWNKFADKLKLPKIEGKIDWSPMDLRDYSFTKSMNDATRFGTATQYASGGFPDVGEMFIAREAGAEMVGRIGNQTAVVNNDQIVQAVSQGVASAIANVIGKSNQPMNLVVNVGGTKLYEEVINSANRANTRAGKTIVAVGR